MGGMGRLAQPPLEGSSDLKGAVHASIRACGFVVSCFVVVVVVVARVCTGSTAYGEHVGFRLDAHWCARCHPAVLNDGASKLVRAAVSLVWVSSVASYTQ